MHIVYWAHSYRDDDAAINEHFGALIEQAEQMMINLDPPSPSVNESKLDQNLRSCDGMVAVLTWRATGPSQYILYEIGLSLRARKPVIAFVDDRIGGDVLPARILQRRFSYRTYFRQFREHTDALRALKNYMGDPPPSRYQPRAGQRTCGLVGLGALDSDCRKLAHRFITERGYLPVDLEKVDIANPLAFDSFEYLANLDVVLSFVDSRAQRSMYWAGAASAAALQSISITLDKDHPFTDQFPRDFQPRLAHVGSAPPLDEVLKTEFDLYEQDFLTIKHSAEIERYIKMQLRAGSLDGRYERNTRQQFMEIVMGDKYSISGQAGAVGPQAHAHDMTFTQVWNQLDDKVDLARLADELERLRQAMEREATEPSHKLAAGAVAAAEQSARQKDGPKVIEYLKSAGQWSLRIAEHIGVELTKTVLKGALGLS
jgi:hypothetical protein